MVSTNAADGPASDEAAALTHYELLGVSVNAGPQALHRAWRRLIRQAHPDLADGDEDRARRAELAARLNEAYATLSDPVRRRGYEYEAGVRSVPCEQCGAPGGIAEGDRVLSLCRRCYHGRVTAGAAPAP